MSKRLLLTIMCMLFLPILAADKELHEAAKHNKVTTIKRILKKQQNVDCLDSRNRTALSYAIEQGNVAALKCLLAYGANPNFKTEKSDDSPLVYLGFLENPSLLKRTVHYLKKANACFDELQVDNKRWSTYAQQQLQENKLLREMIKKEPAVLLATAFKNSAIQNRRAIHVD